MRNLHFALELMKTGTDFLRYAKLSTEVISGDPFRTLLCYCIKQVKPGFWLPLNRNYDVLGLCKGDWSNYESDFYNHMLIKSEDINFDVLWDNESNLPKSNNFFLYSDGSSPTIYYKKTSEAQKTLTRYLSVMETAFFGKDLINFESAWGYKKSKMYEKYYEENLKRVCGNVER